MNGKSCAPILFLIFFCAIPVISQSITVNHYDSTDYERSSLFLEQDRIYGRDVSFEQGLELICLQDKVKAEIQGLGTYYTPLDLNDIPPGDYDLTLSKTGFYPVEIRITVSSQGRSSVTVDLKPLTGLIKLTGLPEGSEVYINNSKIERDLAEAALGEASLRIKAFGYEDYFQIIEIDESEEQTFHPELIKKEFALRNIEQRRSSFWLSDSPSQKINKIILLADAPGEAVLQITPEESNEIIEEVYFEIEEEKTSFLIDISDPRYSKPGNYEIMIKGSDEMLEDSITEYFSVNEGSRSRWRNVFTGSAGFLFCPDPLTLPTGASQIQTGFSMVSSLESIEDYYVPAHLSLRTSFLPKLEMTLGTALYLSPEISEGSIDLYASAKYGFAGGGSSEGFNASALLTVNYNGLSDSYEILAPYDPYGGVSGLSLSLPLSFGISGFSFILSPEFRFSPSYSLEEQGGFTTGDFHIWNYFKGAIAWDRGIFSAVVSAALQSPSYITGGDKWPLFVGLDLSLSPGTSGFSTSLYSGIRYCKGDDLQLTAGAAAGFMF